jgi:hypothetical protein
VTSAYLSVSYLAMSVPVVVAGLAASVLGLDLATVATGYLAATAVIATAAIAASLATARQPEPVRDVFEILEYAPGSTELVA